MNNVLTATAAGMLVAACAMNDPGTGSAMASAGSATLIDASGKTVGRATVSDATDGLHLSVEGMNLPAGVHGMHVHTTGRCDLPTFESAGGHWNPASRQHGAMNPSGPHAGDLPNLTIAGDGRGTAHGVLPGGTLAGLFDGDGAAVVIHATADDMRTDPSGNSGARIACGILTRG